MEFASATTKITAASSVYHWSGCSSGNGFFFLLETTGTPEAPAPVLGNKLLEKLLDNSRLKEAWNLNFLKKLLSEVNNSDAVRSCLIGLLKEDIFYLGSAGLGEVLIRRGERTGLILSGAQTFSGKIIAGDVFLFSTGTFITQIEKTQREELLTIDNQDEVEALASSVLFKNQNSGGSGALLIQFSGAPQQEESSPVSSTLLKENFWQRTVENTRHKISSLLKINPGGPVEEEPASKKILLVISAVLIVLLVLSVFLNLNGKIARSKNQHAQQIFDLVSHQYDEAASLIDLNPGRARTLLSDSKLSLSPLLKEFPKDSPEFKTVTDWLNKIEVREVAAYHIFRLTSAPLFFDMTLIKPGGMADKIAAYDQTAVILDTVNSTLYTLSLDTKKSSIIAGQETVKNAKSVAVHGTSAYVLNTDGIIRIDLNSKSSSAVIPPDDKWGEISAMDGFGGNLYLLDTKNNTVWKYITTETGFLSRESYLNADVRADFSKGKTLAIDGSVWVLAAPDTVMEFKGGLGQTFSFKDFPENFHNIGSLSTSDADKYLYILDTDGKRIVLFDKDGNYQAQYQWDSLKDASDLYASEDQKKIFVLIGSKIYAIDIQ